MVFRAKANDESETLYMKGKVPMQRERETRQHVLNGLCGKYRRYRTQHSLDSINDNEDDRRRRRPMPVAQASCGSCAYVLCIAVVVNSVCVFFIIIIIQFA